MKDCFLCGSKETVTTGTSYETYLYRDETFTVVSKNVPVCVKCEDGIVKYEESYYDAVRANKAAIDSLKSETGTYNPKLIKDVFIENTRLLNLNSSVCFGFVVPLKFFTEQLSENISISEDALFNKENSIFALPKGWIAVILNETSEVLIKADISSSKVDLAHAIQEQESYNDSSISNLESPIRNWMYMQDIPARVSLELIVTNTPLTFCHEYPLGYSAKES